MRLVPDTEKSDRPSPGNVRRATWWSMAVPIAGSGAAVAITVTSGDGHRGAWLFWAALATASGGAAGATFIYGLRRWRELTAIDTITPREVLRPVVLVLIVAMVGVHIPHFIHD